MLGFERLRCWSASPTNKHQRNMSIYNIAMGEGTKCITAWRPSLTLWKSDFMVCWKGDPSSRATRSAARSAAVWGHPSNKDPGSSWQVRQALENKHMAWQNRNVSGHGRAFGNATNSRKFQRGERETRFHSPTSSESLEPDAPSNPQPWTFKWNVVHYRNRARRNIWRTKDWRVLHVKNINGQTEEVIQRSSSQTCLKMKKTADQFFLSASQRWM